MYQRFGLVDVVVSAPVSFIALDPSGSNSEHEGNGNADQLIRDQKKNRRDCHHDKHHSSCYRGLPARRPSYLARLLAYLLQKTERANPFPPHLCRRLIAHVLTLKLVSPGRSGRTRTCNPRFWRPVL